jgi:hypothetical protein
LACGYVNTLRPPPTPRERWDLAFILPRVTSANGYGSSTLLISNPTTSIPGDEIEHRYFQHYHYYVASDLCGNIDTPFWTRFILQECHYQPAIRHEILAISALSKSLMSASNPDNEHLRFALVQQSKALKYLRHSLSGPLQNIRLALVAVLLIGCFESLHGNSETAALQICSGFHLFEEWQEASLNSYTKLASSIPTSIEDEIFPVLTRFRVQLKSFFVMNRIAEPKNKYSEVKISQEILQIPERFTSLINTLLFGVHVLVVTLQWLDDCTLYKSTSPLGFQPVLMDLKFEQEKIVKALELFRTAFLPIRDKFANPSDVNHLGTKHFLTYSQLLEVIMKTGIATEETIFDEFLEQFEEIIKLSTYMLRRDKILRPRSGTRIRYGMGLTFCLFFTATRCRNDRVRHNALVLLRDWACKDGIWDSSQVFKVADWIVKLEEEGRDENGFVPEEWRVRTHTLKWITSRGHISIECYQGRFDGVLTSRKTSLAL